MPRDARPRVTLRDNLKDANRRTWIIVVDGIDAGSIAAERSGERAVLHFSAREGGAGVLRQAIGRLVGAPPFEGTRVLVAKTDAAAVEDRRLLDETGFERVEVGADGMETWERPTGSRPRTGPGRLLDRHGRIAKYPVRDVDLHELLVGLAPRVLTAGEVLTESEINERIRALTDDIDRLRRAFVDHGLVERTMSGTEYALIEDVDNF